MNMKHTEARGPAPGALAVHRGLVLPPGVHRGLVLPPGVHRGLVLPPGVLRALLPDVASAVTNAMSSGPKEKVFGLRKQKDAASAEQSKRAARPTASESQPQTVSCKEPRARNILNPFPCNICKQWFPSRRTLNMHLLRHNEQCGYCHTVFDSSELLRKHMCCIFCKKLYNSKSEYNDHMIQRHGRLYPQLRKINYLQCSVCKLSFTKKTDLIEHVNEMIFSCKRCKKCYRSADEHVPHSKPARQPDSTQSGFTCNRCGEYLEESLSFASHMRTHTKPVKSYSRAPKKPKLSTNVTQTRQDTHTTMQVPSNNKPQAQVMCEAVTSNVKCSEGVDTSRRDIEKSVNEIDKLVCNEKSDLEHNDDESLDVTELDGIKEEPPEFVSREARTNLYSGHQVLGGMVLGPVRMLPPDIVYTIRSGLSNMSSTCKQEPVSDPLNTSPTAEPCSVELEPLPIEEVYIVDTTCSSIKTEDIV